MCGIFFYSDSNPQKFLRIERSIDKITETLRQRGPDHQVMETGEVANQRWLSLNSVLAIRTSINEPSKALRPSDTFQAFAYNGESYEHSHRGKDDSLLFKDFLANGQLNNKESHHQGFFAFFALNNNLLSFGVDYLAEKSLFFSQCGSSFFVSSDLGSIVRAVSIIEKTSALNQNKIREYFCTRHLIQFNETVYENIKKCMPGQIYNYDLQKNKLPDISVADAMSDIYRHYSSIMPAGFNKKEILEITNNYLSDATHDLFGRSDVSFVLSGGVDSTLVTCFAAKKAFDLGERIKTLTLSFGNKDLPSMRMSEVSSEQKTVHVSHDVTFEEYESSLKKLYSKMLMPMPTHSFPSFNVLCSLANRQKSRILVGGEGADEIYNGYVAYAKLDQSARHDHCSLSPYTSVMDEYGIFDQGKIEESDLTRAFQSFDFTKKGRHIQNVSVSLFLDAIVQLSSAGLFCADQVGGLWGIESRSPLANPLVISARLKLMMENSWGPIYDEKALLRSRLESLSPVWRSINVEKQGFSGFPNEIFSNADKEKFCQRVSDLISVPNAILMRKMRSPAVSWKVCNIGSFLDVCG